MDKFIRCFVHQDFTALIIDGLATEEQLQEAWLLILSEYQELKGEGIDTNEQIRLTRDIWRLRNHLFLVDQCIDFLTKKYSESVANTLRRMGYSFNPSDPDKYSESLQSVIDKSKTKYIRLQQLVKELQQLVESVPQVTLTEEHFDNMLINIEEMQRVAYSMDTLTVYKYVILEKKYWRQVELLKTKAAWQQKG